MGNDFFAGQSRLARNTRESAGAPPLLQRPGGRSRTAHSGGIAVGPLVSTAISQPHVGRQRTPASCVWVVSLGLFCAG